MLILLLLFVAGCTDADRSKFYSLGQSQHIECYSGGQQILDDYSTGVVMNEEKSDGYYFKSKSSQKIVHVIGDCVITE